jgi:hypothetical protein
VGNDAIELEATMNDTTGNPAAVTLVGDPLASQLKTAAKTGNFQINTRTGHKSLPQGVTTANIQNLMSPLGLGDGGHCIVIVNSLPTPLVPTGMRGQGRSPGSLSRDHRFRETCLPDTSNSSGL